MYVYIMIVINFQLVVTTFYAVCDLAWHPQCVVELVKFPCKIHKSKDQDVEEDEYIKLFTVSAPYIKFKEAQKTHRVQNLYVAEVRKGDLSL